MYLFRLYLPSLASLALSVAGLPLEAAHEAESISYDGYKAFRINTAGNLGAVMDKLSSLSYDQWNFNSRDNLDISVPGDELSKFESLGLDYTVMHEDLGASINAESSGTEGGVGGGRGLRIRQAAWFDSYHAYTDHVQYFKGLHSAFPNNSEIISQGTSVQNRDLYGLKLFGSGGNGTKEAVIFHGNVHAREWITSMTVEYITNQLLSGYKSGDSDVKTILDKYDMYIFPIVNPDGFVFTQTNNRLWRKNRNPAPSGSNCAGVDLNRNWPYKWDVTSGGSSGNPCDETYRGEQAGDQPETKAMANFVDQVAAKQDIKLYVDFHSYGQYVLSPYGYTCSKLPPNNQKHISLGKALAKAVAAKYGTQFTVGPSCSTLYATDGSSTDYVLDVGKAELTYAFELRDTGNHGFVLPASQIKPSGVEMWAGVKTMLLHM